MMLLSRSRRGQRGFTLTELAIVLGVLGILVAGLFQLTAASNRQVQDQVTAQQIQQYVKGARAYLTAKMDSAGDIVDGAFSTATVVGTSYNITPGVIAFRTGLATLSPQGFTYTVVLRRLTNMTVGATNYPVFSVGVFATGTGNFSRVSMGTVASLVGAEGAGVYPAGVGTCSAAATVLTAFGAVCVVASDYAVGAFTPETERPAALSVLSTLELGSNVSQFLSRVDVPGQPQMTTMSADLHMGGTNNLIMDGAGSITMAGGSINMGGVGNIALAGGSISDTAGSVTINDTLALGANAIASVRDITSDGTATLPTLASVEFINFLFGQGITSNATELLINGNVRINGTLSALSFIYYTPSDRRLKDDIAPINNALDKILKINGVTYELRDSREKSVGVIAQDVEKIFPQLVVEGKDGFKRVNYDGLIGPLIEAVRELANDNKVLRERVQKLEQDFKEKK